MEIKELIDKETLCEKCFHKNVCAIRDSQEEGEEQALKFCSDFKMESVIAMKVITEIELAIEESKYQQLTPFGGEERYNPYLIIKRIAELKKEIHQQLKREEIL